MAKELLFIDTINPNRTDRYGRLLSVAGGTMVRVADGVLVAVSEGNAPACAVALSDVGSPGYYYGDVPAATPSGSYRRLCCQKLGVSPSLADPVVVEEPVPLDWNGTSGLPQGATAQVTKTTLVRTWTVDGVLASTGSIVLADPTGAYGVRRTDTNAVVVPAGTPMVTSQAGVYTCAFTDPAFGLVYQYWFKITDTDGAVWYEEKLRSGPGALPSRSYLLAGDADYLASMLPAGLLPSWLGGAGGAATADAKSRALEQASADVDAAGPFQGRRYDSGQVRQFPRVAYETRVPNQYPAAINGVADVVWDFDPTLQQAVVPTDVKIATLYQAESILNGARAARLDALHDGLASQSAGGLSESYRPGSVAVDGLGVLARQAAILMAKYRLRSGRIL